MSPRAIQIIDAAKIVTLSATSAIMEEDSNLIAADALTVHDDAQKTPSTASGSKKKKGQDCIALTRQKVKELPKILNEAISDMEMD
ncbi:hypothetical protein LOK49_LG10G02903 [Camellia lanceoleosa]|uniref:Uncharacterized protein n=1 Tax=Camellia lanceoleosa TaxID=1840588 RepID=A0ACC0GAB7_9ERIC|nr:hypothetical protein LOK49_LG10G02903 [Camellia lanceoleosa]